MRASVAAKRILFALTGHIPPDTFGHEELIRRDATLTTHCQAPPAVAYCSSVRQTETPHESLAGSELASLTAHPRDFDQSCTNPTAAHQKRGGDFMDSPNRQTTERPAVDWITNFVLDIDFDEEMASELL